MSSQSFSPATDFYQNLDPALRPTDSQSFLAAATQVSTLDNQDVGSRDESTEAATAAAKKAATAAKKKEARERNNLIPESDRVPFAAVPCRDCLRAMVVGDSERKQADQVRGLRVSCTKKKVGMFMDSITLALFSLLF
jgi:hypothetical protein